MRINGTSIFINILKYTVKISTYLKKSAISLFCFIISPKFFNLSFPVFIYFFITLVTFAVLQITFLRGTFIFIKTVVEIFNNFFTFMSHFFSDVFINSKTVIKINLISFHNKLKQIYKI